MAKAFSVASWNVEHFKGDASSARVNRVVNFLKDQNPDDLAIYEVEGKEAFSALTTLMAGYTFHITEGAQTQEILVGVKKTLTAFVTQRTEYNSGVFNLRPGLLATLTVDGENYSVLFMHTKSGDYPRDLGLRDDMFTRAVKFQNVLNGAAANPPGNFIFVGDFNTMGMKYRYVREEDIEVENELLRLDRQAAARGMRRLTKDEPNTFSNGSQSSTPPSDLDQVVTSVQLQFKQFGGAHVSVRGWPKEDTVQDQDKWIADFSDHALLFFEVQKA